jgi:TonB family protein
MAYLPLPSPSDVPKGATPALQNLFQSAPVQPSEVKVLFTDLRNMLNGGSPPLDSILSAITDAARVMTGAGGIALALRSNGTVICRARAGEIAPQLGGRLNVDSGISGECLRTGKALRCDDTQTDDRVDPEVCRVLGIRSIAVVPLHGREGTVGILEALSSRPQAFTGVHLSLLLRLAEVGEVASDQELGSDFEARGSVPPAIPNKIVVPKLVVAASVPDESLMPNVFEGRSFKGWRSYWTIGGIALAVMLMSAVIWISLSDTDGETASSEQPTQSQIAPRENPSHPVLTVPPWKPSTGRIQVRADGKLGKRALHDASIFEPEPLPASEGPFSGLKAGATASQPSPSSEISLPLPPEVTANAPDTAVLATLVSTSATLPAADLAISQGVTEATLVHNVLPVYSSQARAQHLSGDVVVEATIAKDGRIRDLKVISGPPLLAKAATEAIRQWRYHPSLLNGKPVDVHKQITIVFKDP